MWLGFCSLPLIVCQLSKSNVLDVPDLPAIQIGAIWRDGAYETKAAKAFLELLSPA